MTPGQASVGQAPAGQAPVGRRSGWHVIDELDLVRLVSDHAALDQLCARIETLADRLPDRPTPQEAEALCDALRIGFGRQVVRDERLLARLFAAELPQPLCHTLLDHIATRHTACLLQAEDIIVALQPNPEASLCSEAFGFMLRCFFQACRQAMAIEEMAVLTLGGQRLTPAARALLVDRIAISCAQ